MKTSSSKAKGRRLQQTVRDYILSLFPTLEPDDVKSTPMGSKGEDIQLSPAARKVFPYSVECKSRASLPLMAWYQQAAHNAPKGTEPILVLKQDRTKEVVVMDLEHFFSLIRRLQ